jgi:hypothetical protein
MRLVNEDLGNVRQSSHGDHGSAGETCLTTLTVPQPRNEVVRRQLCQKELDSARRPDARLSSDRCRLDGWVLARAAKLLYRASKEGDYKSGHKAEIRDPKSVECPVDFTGGAV